MHAMLLISLFPLLGPNVLCNVLLLNGAANGEACLQIQSQTKNDPGDPTSLKIERRSIGIAAVRRTDEYRHKEGWKAGPLFVVVVVCVVCGVAWRFAPTSAAEHPEAS